MEVLVEIKALMRKRSEHEQAIQAIDQQLREVRSLLGVAVAFTNESVSHAARGHRWSGENSATEDTVLLELAKREPQSVRDLTRLGSTIQQILPRMIERGVLFRQKRDIGERRVYVYARSLAAFGNVSDESADQEAVEAVEAEAG